MPHSELLQVAITAARAGEDVIRHYYQQNIAIEIKSDRTPVTVADRETEHVIHEHLRHAYPDFAFYGEETGRSGGGDYTWLVDPIDGTKAFVRQYPMFSTQIALMHGDQIVLGVSNAPFFDQLACAERGAGAWLNERPLNVSTLDDPTDAAISLGNLTRLGRNAEVWARLGPLLASFGRVRGYGDFLHYHLLAAGSIDAVVESDLNILDVAALSVIVEEAGGRMTQLDGAALNLESRSVLAGNPALHARLLREIAWQEPVG